MSANLDLYYSTALTLAKEAGTIFRQAIYSSKTIETKSSDIDFVTETDQQIEKLLKNGFITAFPDHKFIGEESVSAGEKCELTESPTWIIDPIDGTLNFVHGYPNCCISIALFVDRKPAIAIVYNPVVELLFTAQKGKGAFLNERRISVSKERELSKALVAVERGSSQEPEKLKSVLANTEMLIKTVQGTRSIGSAALNMAMVALGGIDAYFEFGIHIWDIAAGELLVTEAGGVVIDPSGGQLDRLSRRVLCASSPELADKLSQKLIQYYPAPRD